jgi:hypothetical protein
VGAAVAHLGIGDDPQPAAAERLDEHASVEDVEDQHPPIR